MRTWLLPAVLVRIALAAGQHVHAAYGLVCILINTALMAFILFNSRDYAKLRTLVLMTSTPASA